MVKWSRALIDCPSRRAAAAGVTALAYVERRKRPRKAADPILPNPEVCAVATRFQGYGAYHGLGDVGCIESAELLKDGRRDDGVLPDKRDGSDAIVLSVVIVLAGEEDGRGGGEAEAVLAQAIGVNLEVSSGVSRRYVYDDPKGLGAAEETSALCVGKVVFLLHA